VTKKIAHPQLLILRLVPTASEKQPCDMMAWFSALHYSQNLQNAR
jgi:hypothetical protein